MTDEAGAFIEKHKNKPFFMYYALNTPHYPYQGYAKWLKHYAKLPHPRNLYAAFLSTQDETIGNLLTTLDRLKLREDTIIIFQSDHGHSHEERAHFGGGSAGPYRGAKFSMFEGGLRVPAIISWPGKLPEGAVRGNNPRWAVREGDWKLIGNPNDTSKKAALTAKDKLFLVNLRESVSEMKNLAETNPDIVQRLKKLRDDWVAKHSR